MTVIVAFCYGGGQGAPPLEFSKNNRKTIETIAYCFKNQSLFSIPSLQIKQSALFFFSHGTKPLIPKLPMSLPCVCRPVTKAAFTLDQVRLEPVQKWYEKALCLHMTRWIQYRSDMLSGTKWIHL